RGRGAQPPRAGGGDVVTGAAVMRPLPATGGAADYGHVLAGVGLDGPAQRLAALLDPSFLSEAGWDPAGRVLSLPAGHRLLGRAVCRAGGCATTDHTGLGVCHRCFTRLTGQGMTAEQLAGSPQLPALPARVTRCEVPGCQHEATVTQAIVC